jgi:ferredoxin-NADP reductase
MDQVSEKSPAKASPTWQTIGGTVARRLFLDRHAAFWLRELDPVASLDEIRAEVVEIIAETPDVKTFVLRPNARWQGHRAGQFTTIEVEIDGVRTRRCYSISSKPGDSRPTITVKRTPGGRVSNWLHENVKPGHVLTLSPAAGDFVLAEPVPAKLLLLSGGSGITPVMSMLRDLDACGSVGDVVFLHYARSQDDVVFRRALDEIAARHPRLRVVVRHGLFSEEDVETLVPDFAERETCLCGPPGLMERVERLWAEHAITDRLRHERFVMATPAASDGVSAQVKLARSGREVEASGSRVLLDELERAGERPAYGCRMGICRTCKCRKQSGTVQNLLTGEISSEPDEDIQLCISLARSDVTLDF